MACWSGSCAAGLVIREAIIADAPTPANPSFIDQIIASQAVLVSVRLALIAASGYLILSLTMLAIRRQWISKIGWVELGDRQVAANEELVRENEGLYVTLSNLSTEKDRLEEQLRQADNMIDVLLGEDDDLDEEAEIL